MDMVLGKCKFPNSFLPYFQLHLLMIHIGIASMRQLQCVSTTYFFSNKLVFHHYTIDAFF